MSQKSDHLSRKMKMRKLELCIDQGLVEGCKSRSKNGPDICGLYRTPNKDREPGKNYYSTAKTHTGSCTYNVLHEVQHDFNIKSKRSDRDFLRTLNVFDEERGRKIPVSCNSVYWRLPVLDKEFQEKFTYGESIMKFWNRMCGTVFSDQKFYSPPASEMVYYL